MDKPIYKSISPYELIEVYKPTQKLLKDLLGLEYDKLERLKQREEGIVNSCDKRKMPYQEKEDIKFILTSLYIEIPREEIIKKVEHYKKLISIQKYLNTKKKIGEGKESVRLNIEHAKSIPISNYMDFNRGHKALCLWHDDKDPSLYYDARRNRVHCFSCQKGGDVIDVVQKLFDKEFIDAVKIILEK